MSGNSDESKEDDLHSVLDDSVSVDTTGIGVLGGTAQVRVSLPTTDDEDLDDDVIDGETGPARGQSDSAVAAARRVSAVTPSASASKAAVAQSRSAVSDDAKRVALQGGITLTSKRLGELSGSSGETSDLLTSDRLVSQGSRVRPEPEGAWSHFLWTVSGRRINIGDSKRARARKQLDSRIAAALPGGTARFVAVLSRKGGVGKTTVTTLLGMALADARDDRVVAIDANPDRGTLADRIAHRGSKSVRDLVRLRDEVHGYQDISAIVGRDATRLDVIASDADPRIADAFGDEDYRHVANLAAHYYSLVLTDTGTGIVHSVMRETLELTDQVVIVAGLGVDQARLASETLTWLETNGQEALAREAIVVLNKTVPGKSPVELSELHKHFASRVGHVVTFPYDPLVASGGEITFADLAPETRDAARALAATVVESIRARNA